MKITNNYPSIFQVPFPKKRAYISGNLFFKYRQKFRNKTQHEEGIRRILSYPVPNLFGSLLTSNGIEAKPCWSKPNKNEKDK